MIIKSINQWLFVIILSLVFFGCRGDPCQSVRHGGLFNFSGNDTFRSVLNLPDNIPNLPLSQGEDLPMGYYLHKSVPEEYRSFFYEEVLEWNTSFNRELFTIKGIDYNEIDPINNRKDQRNVIYWFDEDQMRDTLIMYDWTFLLEDGLNVAHNFPMIDAENIDDSLSYLKISDADIIIRERFITDIEFVRSFLLRRSRHLGIEVDDNEDIEALQNKLVTYWEGMSIEDTRRLVVRELEYKRDQLLRSNLYTEEEIDLFGRWIILSAAREDIYFASIRNNTIDSYQNINIEDLKNGNIILRNTISHELAHGLGLDHYDKRPDNSNLMSSEIIRTPQDLILTLKPIDDDVRHSLSCTYDF